MSESVLVVPAAGVAFRGFSADRRWFSLLEDASFVPRALAEVDEATRQIIPYVVLRGPGGVFSYGRNARGGEVRLHGLRSIGVGGHVNPGDVSLFELAADAERALAAAARRELAEEMRGCDGAALRWLGFICDDETAVARVHLGVVYAAEAAEAGLSDEGKMVDGRWYSVAELAVRANAYEGWSRLTIEHLASS